VWSNAAQSNLVYKFRRRLCYHYTPVSRLLGLLTQEGDQVVPVLILLQSTECHLCAGNVLLGVLEVFKKSIIVPLNPLCLVGIGV
jgi:hypothetical protein